MEPFKSNLIINKVADSSVNYLELKLLYAKFFCIELLNISKHRIAFKRMVITIKPVSSKKNNEKEVVWYLLCIEC